MPHTHCQPRSLIFRANASLLSANATESGVVLDCPMPWLAGPTSQTLAVGGEPIAIDDGWLLRDGESLAGVLIGSAGAPLGHESWRLYRRLFALTAGLSRYRIWNFVPQINAIPDGTENYVAFNVGRHQAYSETFGGIHQADLSAASAVGIADGPLALAFTAGPQPVSFFENPLQTPAADYPPRYGEKAPLFARSSRVTGPNGSACWHLSGTASIRSSETIGTDFDRQLEVTLENIEHLLAVMEVPAVRASAWKVFLRHRKDLAACRQRLAAAYPVEIDRMMFLEADICRQDLLLEIEALFDSTLPCGAKSTPLLP
jgi:enamine deaminase RidA (YjgF/YER057c/UK114 family)